MEARIAKLEAHVEHIQSDIGDIKTDLRGLREDVGRVKDLLSNAKVWALLLYLALAGTLLGVMAKGFGWLH